MKLLNREPTEEMLHIVDCHEDGTYRFTSLKAMWQAMFDAAPELTVDMEPAKQTMFFCNKCGYFGVSGPLHKQPNSPCQCSYHAASDGPWYSATQLAALQAENERLTAERDELVKATRWKPISNTKPTPKYGEYVLVLTTDADDDPHPILACYNGGVKYLGYNGKQVKPVTHWMPISDYSKLALAKHEGEKHANS